MKTTTAIDNNVHNNSPIVSYDDNDDNQTMTTINNDRIVRYDAREDSHTCVKKWVWYQYKNYKRYVPNTITGTNIPRHTVPTYI